MKPIIQSLLDNDLYKFNMSAAVFQLYPWAFVEYEFINRGGTKFPEEFNEKLIAQIVAMGTLKATVGEIEFLRYSCPHLPPTYLDWLSNFTPCPSQVSISRSKDGEFGLKVFGPWYQAIWWEPPLMATISELYFEMCGETPEEGHVPHQDARLHLQC